MKIELELAIVNPNYHTDRIVLEKTIELSFCPQLNSCLLISSDDDFYVKNITYDVERKQFTLYGEDSSFYSEEAIKHRREKGWK